ncbi:hypothetical protein [Streptomyces parvus]|uniref:ATP synthase subunit I n=1 Tax=Streptomyces parvus TaxID=66428 RepID=A0A7K3RUM0_9ACTN|nr:hypothetical protein [Streptomyces parvus]NEC18930.1 hypothetical protein [Streptomyces parvus]
MPSIDTRILIQAAVPTVAVGAVAAVVGGLAAGGQGAIGAVVATLLVVLFMGIGLFVLQYIAKSLPNLFQAVALMLYVAQILLLFIFIALFKETSLFDPKVFALTLVAATLTWVAGQARAQVKAKIFYIDPDSTDGDKGKNSGHSS